MRERRNYLILLGLIVAALVGAALLILPGSPVHRSPTLGLDLQGGLEVVLEAVPPRDHELTEEDLDRSVGIMRSRIDKLGVNEPEIRKQGGNQIIIQLAGVKDPKTASQLIGKTARLELYDLEADLSPPSIDAQSLPVATTSLYDLLAGQQRKARDGRPEAYYLFNKAKRLVTGPVDSRDKLFNRNRPTLPDGWKVFAVPEGLIVLSCGPSAVVCPGAQESPPARTYYYLFKYQPNAKNPIPEMSGADLKLSGTNQDFDQFGQPVVLMQFTGAGGKKFHDITRREAQRGRFASARLGQEALQHFAIVLDREIRSFPSIDYNEYPDGIDPINGAQITGIRSVGEAKDLALVLQTGALPVEFKQIERTDVSATLGKDSLQEAKTAALIGLLVVGLFLLIFYRFLGLVAVIGLGIYAAFLYAALLIFNVTLTLPGFAGLILTIGVAADANVVIFERIKEEVRAGKSIRAAISAGYQKGFHTIIDANAVTCITALVLFAVATAQVKGFALMLLIGTVISLVTAVAATRAMLGLLGGFKWFDNPRFMGATAQGIPRWQRIDVVGRRRLWFILSLVAIGISVLALALKGLNLGIDFKGGTQVTFRTPQAVSLSKVRDEMGAIGQSDAIVQGRGASEGENYRSFQIRTRSLSAGQQNQLTNGLTERLGALSLGVKNVSASFSRQILRGAILAIIVSFALIALYVTLRYQWRFAVPILRTLVNDVLITIGVYSISGREVTASTVAALLTILGFSIYDTIIVFDRVRENMKLMPRASIATIANVSVWEVLRRSMVTTFITLLPIAALFLFGGETLKDFAFAIMVGILIGAVSTIFIATPLLTVLMERDPEYRRRIGSEVIETGVGGAALAEDEALPPALEPVDPEPEPAPVGAASPAPSPGPTAAGGDGASSRSQTKRERRRQRRRTRPHGRAR